jgi:hypothetical protein
MEIDASCDVGQRQGVAGEPFALLEPRVEFRRDVAYPPGGRLDPLPREALIGDVFPEEGDQIVVLDDTGPHSFGGNVRADDRNSDAIKSLCALMCSPLLPPSPFIK